MENDTTRMSDTGERIIPPEEGEVSFVFARHRYAYLYASQFVHDCMVLDVGCGTGYGCKILAERARFVCGADHDTDALNYCKRHFLGPDIAYVQADAGQLGFKKCFDVTVSYQVIEHMADPAVFIRQLRRVTRDDGLIFLSTPNVRKPVPSDRKNPFHASEFNAGTLRDLLDSEFASCDIYGVVYASKSVVRRLVQSLPFYQWGKYLRRGSMVKKFADRTMDLTKFTVSRTLVDESMDLLAVCRNF